MRNVAIAFAVLVVGAILLRASAYTVNPAEQVVLTQFGEPRATVTEPGLYFRTPFVQEVNRLEKRLLPWDGDPENMPTKDKKRIFIDVWARWRIVEPRTFFKRVRTVTREISILDDLIDSAVRDIIASNNLIECVRTTNDPLKYETEEFQVDQARTQEHVALGRQQLEKLMLTQVNAADLPASYGIEVVEVHIKRVNYVKNVRDRVYERMISERTRIAKLFESEAEEERNRIIGSTRKELDEIEGDMEQRSAEIRGEADAAVIKIYAEAIGQDLEFFEFLRLLEAYEKTLRSPARLILSTDNEFLKLLRGPTRRHDAE